MPFLAAAPTLGTTLLAGGGLAALGGVLMGNKASKAAGNSNQVNIDELDAKARDIAQKNATQSAALERQLTPEVPALRQQANLGVLHGLDPTENEKMAEAYIASHFSNPVAGEVNSPLLRAAIDKAKADLALGGAIPQDVRNLVARSSLANAGMVGGNLGLGRDLVARDLGLTSLDLSNRRLANASNLGQMEQSANEFDVGTRFNNAANIINNLNLLRSLHGDQFGRNLSAANYGESIARPVVGLDPGSVADIAIGNQNSANAAAANKANIQAANAQGMYGLAGQLGTAGLMAYAKMCWVAREVYGANNRKWRLFRNWLFTQAPKSLFDDYLAYGFEVAKNVRNNQRLKAQLRVEMDQILSHAY